MFCVYLSCPTTDTCHHCCEQRAGVVHRSEGPIRCYREVCRDVELSASFRDCTPEKQFATLTHALNQQKAPCHSVFCIFNFFCDSVLWLLSLVRWESPQRGHAVRIIQIVFGDARRGEVQTLLFTQVIKIKYHYVLIVLCVKQTLSGICTHTYATRIHKLHTFWAWSASVGKDWEHFLGCANN
jgi:hypothetical protein